MPESYGSLESSTGWGNVEGELVDLQSSLARNGRRLGDKILKFLSLASVN